MRSLTRMGQIPGLLGLVLAASTAALADPPKPKPIPNPWAGVTARPGQSVLQKGHLCADCQRSQLRARGINVMPAPPLPHEGTVVSSKCDRCGAPAVVSKPLAQPPSSRMTMTPGSTVSTAGNCVECATSASTPAMLADGAGMPGRAVVGGDAPGYVVVGGTVPTAEPTPIGTVQGRYAYQGQGAAPGAAGMPLAVGRPGSGAGAGAVAGGRGSSDPSVMPTGMASEAYLPARSGRPQILTHLFGLDGIGRRGREERERRERENHASISYQPQGQQVSELPSSMVYGR